MSDEQINEVVHLRSRVSEFERELEEARDVLAGLSSWVGNGMGDDSTPVDEYKSRIRDGVAWIIGVECKRTLEALADARELRDAGKLMLKSLGEYVRQSMDQNPEWNAGIRALREAVEVRPEPTGIYVVSKVRHAPMWKQMRDDGVPIISSWIDVDDEPDSELWSRCLKEAASAKQIVVYVEPGERLKGALVEIGAGLARGVPITVVGDPTGQGTWWRARNVTRVSEWEGLTAPSTRSEALSSELLDAARKIDASPHYEECSDCRLLEIILGKENRWWRRVGVLHCPTKKSIAAALVELRRLADTLDTGCEDPSGIVTCALAHVGILENERDDARKAGGKLYDYLHFALNTWLPGMAEEAGCDEEEGNEGIMNLTELLAETAKPLGKEP